MVMIGVAGVLMCVAGVGELVGGVGGRGANEATLLYDGPPPTLFVPNTITLPYYRWTAPLPGGRTLPS